jgi:hypothetical protein
LRKNEVLLQALASSPALARGDWAAFDAQARVATRGMDSAISLIDPEGFLVASTRARARRGGCRGCKPSRRA